MGVAVSPAPVERHRRERGPWFRPDVEGLRAVAIGGVLLYHAGVPVATGGYVGVDVFFVISAGAASERMLLGVARTSDGRALSNDGDEPPVSPD